MIPCRLPPPRFDPPRSLDVVTAIVEKYPPKFRRWCEPGEGCACMGCVRWPPQSTVRGDPEGKLFTDPDDQLSKEEFAMWKAATDDRSDS